MKARNRIVGCLLGIGVTACAPDGVLFSTQPRPSLPEEPICDEAMFRGDAGRTGRTGVSLPRTEPEWLWTVNIAGLDVGAGDTWYGGQPHRSEPEDLPAPEYGNMFVAPSPVVCGDSLYVASHFGRLLALDPSSGATRWTYDADGEIDGTPVVSGGRIYFGATDDVIRALDQATGAELWRYTMTGDSLASPSLRGHRVFTSDKNGGVVPLDQDGGAPVGERQLGGTITTSTSWSDDGEAVLVAERTGSISALGVEDGALQWEFLADEEVLSTGAFGDGAWFIGSWDNKIYALDRHGGLRWSVTTGANVTSSPAFIDDRVIVGSWDWVLYALDVHDGSEIWRIDLGSDLLASPVTDGQTLLQWTETGDLHGIDVATGEDLWNVSMGVRVVASPGVKSGSLFGIGVNGDLAAWGWDDP